MINERYAIYFVLNGLHNGEDGVYARTIADEQQKDGWYYLLADSDDGIGPYESRDAATLAAETAAPLKPQKLPSQWAQEGYYVVERWTPKVGQECDYYGLDGNKYFGKIVKYDGKEISIEGERKVFVTDTFKVRFGR